MCDILYMLRGLKANKYETKKEEEAKEKNKKTKKRMRKRKENENAIFQPP